MALIVDMSASDAARFGLSLMKRFSRRVRRDTLTLPLREFSLKPSAFKFVRRDSPVTGPDTAQRMTKNCDSFVKANSSLGNEP